MKKYLVTALNFLLLTAVFATYAYALDLSFAIRTDWETALPQLNASLFFLFILVLAFIFRQVYWTKKSIS